MASSNFILKIFLEALLSSSAKPINCPFKVVSYTPNWINPLQSLFNIYFQNHTNSVMNAVMSTNKIPSFVLSNRKIQIYDQFYGKFLNQRKLIPIFNLKLLIEILN
jgi:hypothetical protein